MQTLWAILLAMILQQAGTVGLRVIVVRTDAEASSLLARIEAGERFEELASRHSIDPSARAGGYLGIVNPSALRQEYQDAIRSLRPGQTTTMTRAGTTYVLLQVLDALEIQGMSAMEAAARGNIAPLQAWIAAGGNVRSGTVERFWAQAVLANQTAIAKMLADAGINVNMPLDDGSTVLMQAARAGRPEILRTLIDARADVNAKGPNGLTALMQAAYGGQVETVRLLLGAGADVNASLNNGSNALMAAALTGQSEIVQTLLGAGANVNARTANGSTALMEAAYAGKLDTVRILLAARADVNPALNTGMTALMGAAMGGHTEIVRALVNAGADVAARDSKGQTALVHAQSASNAATVTALLNAGPEVSALERSMSLGRTYGNDYYVSNDLSLLDRAAAEFEKVLAAEPANMDALEWMAALEVLRWQDRVPGEGFRRARSFLDQCVKLDPMHPEMHYWIAAVNSIFVRKEQNAAASERALLILLIDEGIEHARKAIELDPLYADAMAYLGTLYRQKAERAGIGERPQLMQQAELAEQNARKIRSERGSRPSRFSDQFSRPSLPAAPAL